MSKVHIVMRKTVTSSGDKYIAAVKTSKAKAQAFIEDYAIEARANPDDEWSERVCLSGRGMVSIWKFTESRNNKQMDHEVHFWIESEEVT
ncbi:hypothetical protein N9937_00105 [bacterium]|nr:hypothetical protein [bacterium]